MNRTPKPRKKIKFRRPWTIYSTDVEKPFDEETLLELAANTADAYTYRWCKDLGTLRVRETLAKNENIDKDALIHLYEDCFNEETVIENILKNRLCTPDTARSIRLFYAGSSREIEYLATKKIGDFDTYTPRHGTW